MVRVWIMNELDGDRHMEHFTNPPKFLSTNELFNTTGVEYFKIDHEYVESDLTLRELKISRGYSYEFVECCSNKYLPEQKMNGFYTEHLHTEEESRLILEGSGYFDVRNAHDQWIRIEAVAGDLIIIPSGIYHRFTLTVNNFIKSTRYFADAPLWDRHNRPAEDMIVRREYLQRLQNGFQFS